MVIPEISKFSQNQSMMSHTKETPKMKDEEIFKCYVTNVLTASQKINLNKRFTLKTPKLNIVSKRSNTKESTINNQAFINFANLQTPPFTQEDSSPSR